ncbi:helix-turn-helix domain-containing protein [bacterium]|nr:helix-turn-helix domain-containing protein [bacterium]
MGKTSSKSATSVLDMIREIEDDDFAAELETILAERRILKSLIAMRIAAGVSQGDIADKLGCSQSRVSKLERANDGDLKLDELAAYGAATGREFEILAHRKGSTPVDRVKAYAFCIHRELKFLASLAKGDQSMAQGVSAFIGEALFNVVKAMKDAAKTLPKRPPITMELDADELDDDCPDEAAAAQPRKRAKRRRREDAVPA